MNSLFLEKVGKALFPTDCARWVLATRSCPIYTYEYELVTPSLGSIFCTIEDGDELLFFFWKLRVGPAFSTTLIKRPCLEKAVSHAIEYTHKGEIEYTFIVYGRSSQEILQKQTRLLFDSGQRSKGFPNEQMFISELPPPAHQLGRFFLKLYR